MTLLRHECLSKRDQQSPFDPTKRRHRARCTCGHETMWLPTLREAEERMDQHTHALRGQLFVSDLTASGMAFRRRMDATALEIASEAMREEARVNKDLRAERLYSRQDHIMWFAVAFLIVTLLGAALYFEHKGERHAVELSR